MTFCWLSPKSRVIALHFWQKRSTILTLRSCNVQLWNCKVPILANGIKMQSGTVILISQMESGNSVQYTRKIYGPFGDTSSNYTFLKDHYNYRSEILLRAWLLRRSLSSRKRLCRAAAPVPRAELSHLLEVKTPSVQSLEEKGPLCKGLLAFLVPQLVISSLTRYYYYCPVMG